jgi:HAD superfamily hydrolase (TIGR01549 family)
VIPAFDAYLFDLDGTLLNSALDICGAVQQVLSATDESPTFSHEFLQGYIGRHLIELFGDIFPHYSADQIDRMIQDYRTIYLARGHTQTAMYPGVMEALAVLPGRKATATTKGTPTTRAVLQQFGLIQFFDHVQGTDGIPCKPAPDVLLAALNGLAAQPADCLMVGDSAADMEAGRRAGVKICAVRYGYGKPEDLAKWTPDYWISDLRELLPRQSRRLVARP